MFAGVELRAEDAPDPGRMFQPIVCVIDGVRAVGARCGEVMPSLATIRTERGELTIERSTVTVHDENGGQDYPPPYGPACCMYETCEGRTVPYRAAPGAPQAAGDRYQLAVWPADADVELVLGTRNTDGVTLDELPTGPDQPNGVVAPISGPDALAITQVQVRGSHRYASVHNRGSGQLYWSAGAGWTRAADELGSHGYEILGTTDVDHDGHPELIALERWANDYGLDVFGDAAAPLYHFSCGNI